MQGMNGALYYKSGGCEAKREEPSTKAPSQSAKTHIACTRAHRIDPVERSCSEKGLRFQLRLKLDLPDGLNTLLLSGSYGDGRYTSWNSHSARQRKWTLNVS